MTLICIGCGNTVEHDTEAESWLKTTVLVDLNVCDGVDSGRLCPETGYEHQLLGEVAS